MKTLGILALATYFISTAAAEPFCEGLRKVVGEAPNHFKSLRGNFDSTLGEYDGRVTFGELDDCATSSGKGVSDYQCQIRLPDNLATAQARFVEVQGQIKSCYGAEIRQKYGKEARVVFEVKKTHDDISVRYGRITPKKRAPFYYIIVEVGYVEMNQ